MTEVLQSPSHFPSPQSSSPATCAHNNNDPHQHSLINSITAQGEGGGTLEQHGRQSRERKERERQRDQLSLLTFVVAAFRKSLIGCSSSSTESKELCSSMEIGWPSNVRHVAHVTFDRFNGFLGLPSEFEPEVPRRAPSASANVFGVSTESMQLSFDSRGNSVPTILLMMQRRLYERGGLQAEGIFRITTENSHEEYVREQLNRGIVPDDVDVHCLAGLVKAWFRELPTGVLDSLLPEQVMQAQSEEDYIQLVRLLPQTEAALLDWAVNLMADVVQLEHLNKMDARNIAVVFAPNMTKMADPLTALVYAVQVMNFLKTLIIKTLREREDSVIDAAPELHLDSSDESGHNSSSEPANEDVGEDSEAERTFLAEDPVVQSPPHSNKNYSTTDTGSQNYLSCSENFTTGSYCLIDNCPCEVVSQVTALSGGHKRGDSFGAAETVKLSTPCKPRNGPLINSCHQMGTLKINDATGQAGVPLEKKKGTDIVSRINSQTELVEAWR